MKDVEKVSMTSNKSDFSLDRSWPWWPLLPLYPYGFRRTLISEIIPNQIWSFEQLQGLYYVAVPVRLTVVKVSGGLMLFNPLPPTAELLKALNELIKKYGPVLSIILPTASGLEHKIALPSIARAFPEALVWVCPGQWSFPLNMSLPFLGVSSSRTKYLLQDGVPHEDCTSWIPLGPLDIGLGRFQEVSCFHHPSKALLVTDALVGIEARPPSLFDFDPTPLLFHSRERGDEPLFDSYEQRLKGWARLVLFASFLRPALLEIPSWIDVFRYSFKKGLRNPKAHFGLFPFIWKEGWEDSAKKLLGEKEPLLQVAPVLERLIFPRSKNTLFEWLDNLSNLKGMKWLVSAHFSALVPFDKKRIRSLKNNISSRKWADSQGDFSFLSSLDQGLFNAGIVPKDPLKAFKD